MKRGVAAYAMVAYGGAFAIDAVLLNMGLSWLSAPLLLLRMWMVAAGVAAAGLVEGIGVRSALRRAGLRACSLEALLGAASIPVLAYILATLAATALGLGEPHGPYTKVSEMLGVPPLVLAALLLAAGIAAGVSINMVAALGEELGWRGLLYEELVPRLGLHQAAILVGVAWGLWHAPLIAILGYNYGGVGGLDRLAVFTLYTVAVSLPAFWVRSVTGSVLAPAALHGTVNAVAGLWLGFYEPRSPEALLYAPPAGLLAAASMMIAYAVARLVYRVVSVWRGGGGYASASTSY